MGRSCNDRCGRVAAALLPNQIEGSNALCRFGSSVCDVVAIRKHCCHVGVFQSERGNYGPAPSVSPVPTLTAYSNGPESRLAPDLIVVVVDFIEIMNGSTLKAPGQSLKRCAHQQKGRKKIPSDEISLTMA